MVVFAVLRGLTRVCFRSRAEIIAENLFLRRQLAPYQESSSATAGTRSKVCIGRLESVFSVGTGAGDC
jgi:hypothetical protein